MFKLTLDEFLAWVNLVFVEIFCSLIAIASIGLGAYLISINSWGFGILSIFVGLIFIGLFIGAIKSYLK